jgi:hypothetical protein
MQGRIMVYLQTAGFYLQTFYKPNTPVCRGCGAACRLLFACPARSYSLATIIQQRLCAEK